MEAPSPSPPHPPHQRVPDELLQKLHDANQKLHESKEHLERQMAGTEFRHQERVNEAEGRFRSAEREIEEVTDQIEPYLAPLPVRGGTGAADETTPGTGAGAQSSGA